jgi:glucuronokinase
MSVAERVGRGSAPARVALAGNPSDGYGGAVLAVALPAFCAEVRVAPGSDRGPDHGPESELVAAAVARFARETGIGGASTCGVSWRTAVPRGVGLGGSSAIVIATLRALCELFDVSLGADQLAGLALAVETEELGIAAGLQDRVAQAHGGLTFMDFAAAGPGSGHGRYEPLDPALLPPLVVCWRDESAADSGVTHSDLRERFDRGDRLVGDGLAAAAAAARDAHAALLAGDHGAFARAVDATFDARQRMLPLDSRHVEMIAAARAAGAAANYTGSGGAIVAVCSDESHRRKVSSALSGLPGLGVIETDHADASADSS